MRFSAGAGARAAPGCSISKRDCLAILSVSAVERAGLGTLNEGQKLSFDLERGQQGKTSATNLKAV